MSVLAWTHGLKSQFHVQFGRRNLSSNVTSSKSVADEMRSVGMQCGPGSKAKAPVIADVKLLGPGALQHFGKEVIAFPDGARISLRSNTNRPTGLIYSSTAKR